MESKWIKFLEGEPNKKTKVFLVVTNSVQVQDLGWIKWYGPWRKYSFFPQERTVFETDCLNDIVKFINKLMLDRKVELQNQKQKTA